MTGGVRLWWDPAGKAYGGYELHIEPLGNGQFNFLVQGLGSAMAGFHRMGLPAAIPPLVLRAGERIEIDLFREAHYRLFDRVEVER